MILESMRCLRCKRLYRISIKIYGKRCIPNACDVSRSGTLYKRALLCSKDVKKAIYYKLAKQGICIDKCSISILCPAGQFLKSLRWGLPQSPVIASRAVRLCMSSGHFAVTGRNKKSEARLCRSIPVLPCLFSSVLVYFLLPVFRGLPLFFHLLAVEHFHVLPRLQKFLHLLLRFPVVTVRRLFL